MFLQDDIPLSFLLAGTELLRKVREAHGSRERLQRIIYTHSFAEGAPAPIDLTGSPLVPLQGPLRHRRIARMRVLHHLLGL